MMKCGGLFEGFKNSCSQGMGCFKINGDDSRKPGVQSPRGGWQSNNNLPYASLSYRKQLPGRCLDTCLFKSEAEDYEAIGRSGPPRAGLLALQIPIAHSKGDNNKLRWSISLW